MNRDPRDTPVCGRRFAEELLSGYLDRALTQGDEQRVRLHLEDCAACRRLVGELEELRQAARATRFTQPPDDLWDERPRGLTSRLLRGGGWLLLITWLVAMTAFATWTLATSPESLWLKLLIFGGATGTALLLLSVLVDRLRTLPFDRYRRIQR